MDNLTAGNPRAHRIRVYFEGTGTIYEGMPVCYNYDTTDNWFGGSVADTGEVTATGTTAEGSQNEGKYIRVELPADGNLIHLAGFVAKGGWVGTTGAKSLDIYVPNGAIVPVRCDVDTTSGATILFMQEGEEELGYSNGISTSRPVAIAMETETALDGTADITLAKIDPNLFMYQTLDGTALSIGTGTQYGAIDITTASTAWNVGPTTTYTNTGTGAGGTMGFRYTITSLGTAIAGTVYGGRVQCNIGTGGVLGANQKVTGLWAKAYTATDAGTNSGSVYGLQVSVYNGVACGGYVAMIYFDEGTAVGQNCDYLFVCYDSGPSASCAYTADTTGTNQAGAIKVRIRGADHYLHTFDSTAGAT